MDVKAVSSSLRSSSLADHDTGRQTCHDTLVLGGGEGRDELCSWSALALAVALALTLAVPCASLPLFTSAIVPLHVSTTIWDRHKDRTGLYGDLGPSRAQAACCEPRRPIASLSLTLLLPLLCALPTLCTAATHFSAGEKSTTFCSRPMHEPSMSSVETSKISHSLPLGPAMDVYYTCSQGYWSENLSATVTCQPPFL